MKDVITFNFINRCKVQIQEFGFQSGRNVEAIEMSFSDLFQPINAITQKKSFVEKVNDVNNSQAFRTFGYDDDEDVGSEIQFLSQSL